MYFRPFTRKLKDTVGPNSGMTLIELLVVILIIGILSSIAVPSYMGQRDKAKQMALEGSARGVYSSFVPVLEAFTVKSPIVLMGAPSTQTCYEYALAPLKMKCSTVYPDMTSVGTYSTWDDLLEDFIVHHNIGLESISPYDGSPLLTRDIAAANGKVALVNTNDSSFSFAAYTTQGVLIANYIMANR